MTATRSMTSLSDEIITRCGERAAGYDRENRFVGKTVPGIDLGEQPRWG